MAGKSFRNGDKTPSGSVTEQAKGDDGDLGAGRDPKEHLLILRHCQDDQRQVRHDLTPWVPH